MPGPVLGATDITVSKTDQGQAAQSFHPRAGKQTACGSRGGSRATKPKPRSRLEGARGQDRSGSDIPVRTGREKEPGGREDHWIKWHRCEGQDLSLPGGQGAFTGGGRETG